jgi:hypothetical protein
MAPGSPNPLDEPWLPFPFTARQLAALMTDGWGYFIQEKYGDWDDGPDEDELHSVGMLGGKAKEALVAAYRAYRHAVDVAPRLDRGLESAAGAIAQQYDVAREAVMAQEGLRVEGIAGAESVERLARVNDAVADLRRLRAEARKTANDAHSRWRRAVVQHLLLPVEQVPADAFESMILRAIPTDRRAEAIHQLKMQQGFQNSNEGKAHWDLLCQQHDVECALLEYQQKRPQSITEIAIRDDRVKQLKDDLAAISKQLAVLAASDAANASLRRGASAGDLPALCHPALLATRDALCSAFGGYGLRREWFDDLHSRSWLLAARKVVGKGQRGQVIEPLFCPFEVMNGLVEKSRKSRLTAEAGWRILESRFPAVYAQKHIADPREPPG